MKKKKINYAVSELVSVVLLLAIVTAVMAIVFLQLSSDKGPNKQTFANLVGTVDKTNLIVTHNGGDPIDTNTDVSFTYAGKKYNYKVSDVLTDTNHNGFWDIGEKITFPFTYDLENLSDYQTIDIMATDKESNSIQFLGSVTPHPVVDLKLVTTVSPTINPKRYDYINVTITVTCLGGDIDGSANIKVKFLIPQGLLYISSKTQPDNSTSKPGTYNNTTGIWSIKQIIHDEPVILNVKLQVTSIGFREFIQFALILDGSGSILPADWALMQDGLYKALKNNSIFPVDKSVELTVIQFGTYMGNNPWNSENKWGAQVEIPPTIINNDTGTSGYFLTSADKLHNLTQTDGNTPMGCGIRLAADQVRNSINFSSNRKQIILMVTDGVPNCNWTTGYWGRLRNENIGKTTTVQAEAYLNTTLFMKSGQDQFNVFAVGSGPDITWLNQSIAWPQPGHIAPPFISGRGWVSKVTTWEQFSERINYIFHILFDSITVNPEIESAFTIDPYLLNNVNPQVVTPTT
ncbi:Uncharacterised protein [uncultured archaeon]|nr:Uncharacterised protein [uncultured archaeon]